MNIKILQQTNIPKPLHGVNPRTIMGQSNWDKIRKQVYKNNAFCCEACGVYKYQALFHNWVECHEDYVIDYPTGTVTVNRLIPLCHACHNFIHSGRLYHLYCGDKIGFDRAKTILEYGFKLLASENLKCFGGTLKVAQAIGNINTYDVNPDEYRGDIAPWEQWKLIYEGKEYYSKFKNINEWRNFYK